MFGSDRLWIDWIEINRLRWIRPTSFVTEVTAPVNSQMTLGKWWLRAREIKCWTQEKTVLSLRIRFGLKGSPCMWLAFYPAGDNWFEKPPLFWEPFRLCSPALVLMNMMDVSLVQQIGANMGFMCISANNICTHSKSSYLNILIKRKNKRPHPPCSLPASPYVCMLLSDWV